MQQLALSFAQPAPGSRFDLSAPGFREHLLSLTGVSYTPWWDAATYEDACNLPEIGTPDCPGTGQPAGEGFGKVWLFQTRKIQVIWDAWSRGERISLDEVYRRLGID